MNEEQIAERAYVQGFDHAYGRNPVAEWVACALDLDETMNLETLLPIADIELDNYVSGYLRGEAFANEEDELEQKARETADDTCHRCGGGDSMDSCPACMGTGKEL